jgi:hypothetical protein
MLKGHTASVNTFFFDGTKACRKAIGNSLARALATRLILESSEPKCGDGIEWKLRQDPDFLRDA